LDVKTYIESGILELYVLGQLSPEEEKEVQEMQSKHIEIQREIHEISVVLEKYAQLNAIKVPSHVAERIFENLPSKSAPSSVDSSAFVPPKSGLKWNALTTLFALLSVLGFSMYFILKMEHNSALQKYESDKKACDSIALEQQQLFAIINQINDPNNKIIDMTPTAGYAGISVYLHYNAVTKKNLLQLVKLPDITSDQAFQLWSLKDGADPMPLDVFADKNKIIEVDFVDNTATYAITIEPKAGSKSPTLEKLIGTMGVI
jgi:anti-sigma-K factor RskA